MGTMSMLTLSLHHTSFHFCLAKMKMEASWHNWHQVAVLALYFDARLIDGVPTRLQYSAILLNTLEYFAILLNTLQYFAILLNTLEYFAIHSNSFKYFGIL